MEIQYLQGDATSPQAKGYKIICHICNNLGGWEKGFVVAISNRWPEPEKAYREWHRDRAQNDFDLGNVQFVEVEKYICIANMIGQQGMKPSKQNGPPVRYEAIENCLNLVGEKALELEASIHMPRIGCGLAGGKWSKIEPLILEHLISKDIPTYVYDFD